MSKKVSALRVEDADVMSYLRLKGGFDSAVSEVAKRKVTAAAARAQGIRITTRELQKAADVFRIDRGLFKASETQKWLKANGLTVEDLEEFLETGLLVSKFKQTLEAQVKSAKLVASPLVKATVRESAYQVWIERAMK